MDFGTIRTKLREHKYVKIQEFIADIELVFFNCKLYNGETTEVGKMGKAVHDEFNRLKDQLSLSFYMWLYFNNRVLYLISFKNNQLLYYCYSFFYLRLNAALLFS